MSYEKNTWANGDVITAAKLNNIEEGIASAGGCAIVKLSAFAYGSGTQTYGYIVYATYDSTNLRWVIMNDALNFWEPVMGYGNAAPSIIPPYLTVLPTNEEVSLFFVEANNATVTVTGNISQTNLYYSYGSVVDRAYRITGDGSISLDNG